MPPVKNSEPDLPAQINLSRILVWQEKPEPFTPGKPQLWDDPHISTHLLEAHLDPEIDAASRNPATIDRSVAWLVNSLGLKQDDAVLDLGCGPGLYALRLAQRGLDVTGVDLSRRSIAHARQAAEGEGLEINYRHQNYLTLNDENQFEAALLIFGDYCTFKPEDRALLLRNIHRALKPDGYFVLDVTTPQHREQHGVRNGWYASPGGFWQPGPHLVLEEGFNFPDQMVWLDQYIVLDENGALKVYRNWFQDYDKETITLELAAGGFKVESLWSDLAGEPFQPNGEWIGVMARKRTI